MSTFDDLKEDFYLAPIFVYFYPDHECVVETVQSDYISVGILLQLNDNDILHLFAYFSKKHSIVKYNEEIYNKELMAIKRT